MYLNSFGLKADQTFPHSKTLTVKHGLCSPVLCKYVCGTIMH